MAIEHELERMVIRLMGDAGHYQKILDDAVAATESAGDEIEKAAKEAAAQKRMLEAAAQAENAAIAEASRIAASVRTPVENYKTALQGLDEHVMAGRLNQEDYERAVDKLYRTLPRVQEQERLAAQEQERLNQAMIRGRQVTASMETVTERYSREVAELNQLLKVGAIDNQTYTRAMRAASAPLPGLGDNLTRAGSVATGIGVAITAAFGGTAYAASQASMRSESLRLGLEAVSGSAEEAERQILQLREVAKLPGLGFPEAVQGSVNLQAARFSADLANRSLAAFGNALATVGKGRNELQGVILALTQMSAKGKISAEEINQIAERVPQIRKVMEQAFGTSNTEVLQKMNLDVNTFVEGVVAELEKLPKMGETSANTMENFGDATDQALTKIGDRLNTVMMPGVNMAAAAVDWFNNSASEGFITTTSVVIGLGTGIGSLTTTLGTAGIAAGQLVSGYNALKVSLQGAAVAQTAMNVASTAGYAAAGVAAIGIGIYAGKIISDMIPSIRQAKEIHQGLMDQIASAPPLDLTDTTDMGRIDFVIKKTEDQIANLKAHNEEIKSGQAWWNFWQSGADGIEANNAMLDKMNERLGTLQKKRAELEGQKAVDSGKVVDPKAIESIQEYTAQLQAQADTIGMESEEAKIAMFQRQGVPDSYIQASVAALAHKQAVVESYKAQQEESKRIQQLKDDLKGLEQSLQMQIATYGMSSRESAIFQMRQRGVGGEALSTAIALSQQLDRMDAYNKSMEEGKRIIEQYLTPEEKFLKTHDELTKLKDIGAFKDSPETFKRAMEAAEQELIKAKENSKVGVEFEIKGLDVIRAGTQEYRRLVGDTLKLLDGRNGKVTSTLPQDVLGARDKKRQEEKLAADQAFADNLDRMLDPAYVESLAGNMGRMPVPVIDTNDRGHIDDLRRRVANAQANAVGTETVTEATPVTKPVTVDATDPYAKKILERIAKAQEAANKRPVLEVKTTGLRR